MTDINQLQPLNDRCNTFDTFTLYFLECVKKQELYFFLFLDKSKHSILFGMIANENNIH